MLICIFLLSLKRLLFVVWIAVLLVIIVRLMSLKVCTKELTFMAKRCELVHDLKK